MSSCLASGALQVATEKEIQEAILVASLVSRDSVYLNGIDYDMAKFKRELDQIAAHLSKAATR